MEELLTFFEPGSIITTRLGHNREWVVNSVLDIDIDNQVIIVGLKQEYIECLIARGIQIELRMFSSGNIIFAKGVVQELLLDSPQSVIIKIESTSKIKDLREEPRYDVNLMSMIKGPEIEYDYISIVKDISLSGVGVLGTQSFSIGMELFLDIFISETNTLKLKGTVVRKESHGYNIQYGISSTPIDDQNKLILEDLIKTLIEKNNESILQIKRLRAKIASTE